MNHAAGMQEVYMYAVVRTYSGAGAKELFNLLEQRKADVEAVRTNEGEERSRISPSPPTNLARFS